MYFVISLKIHLYSTSKFEKEVYFVTMRLTLLNLKNTLRNVTKNFGVSRWLTVQERILHLKKMHSNLIIPL